MKKFKMTLSAVAILLAGTAYAVVGSALVDRNSAPVDPARFLEPQHGTHLCSEDEHCGSGHKCCDGHCMMVSTCG